jgi:hypothetical protein
VVDLFTTSSSGHRSSKRARRNPRLQISPPWSGDPAPTGIKPTTSRQPQVLSLTLTTPTSLLRLPPATPGRRAREGPGRLHMTLKAGGEREMRGRPLVS